MRRPLLIRAVAYRLQEKALGGLKPATQRLLASVADDAKARQLIDVAREGKVKPGTTLLREWHGLFNPHVHQAALKGIEEEVFGTLTLDAFLAKLK